MATESVDNTSTHVFLTAVTWLINIVSNSIGIPLNQASLILPIGVYFRTSMISSLSNFFELASCEIAMTDLIQVRIMLYFNQDLFHFCNEKARWHFQWIHGDHGWATRHTVDTCFFLDGAMSVGKLLIFQNILGQLHVCVAEILSPGCRTDSTPRDGEIVELWLGSASWLQQKGGKPICWWSRRPKDAAILPGVEDFQTSWLQEIWLSLVSSRKRRWKSGWKMRLQGVYCWRYALRVIR